MVAGTIVEPRRRRNRLSEAKYKRAVAREVPAGPPNGAILNANVLAAVTETR